MCTNAAAHRLPPRAATCGTSRSCPVIGEAAVGPVIRRWEGSRVLDVRARVWDGGDEGEGEAEEGCAGGREKEGVETAIWESG
jgi:hypothetical protein